jgi:tRNA(Ile)-lysidine synthase
MKGDNALYAITLEKGHTDMSMHILVEHVLQTAEGQGLWSPHDTIIVAVSGGPDSVALLHVMHKISHDHIPLNLICAHVHHGFRVESDDEAVMVQEMAEGLGIPFVMEAINVPAYMKESGKGAEEAARDKRYEFLLKIAKKNAASSIALGHHADDQAETVLLHLLRGSGPSGLVGMKFKRNIKNVELIRPFLRIYKTDLVDVCESEKFRYAIDRSNLQTKYRRNAIRLDILPYLRQYNGRITQSLNQLSNVMTAEDEYMELAAEKLFNELVRSSDGRFTFGVPSFLEVHVALQRRLIKLILNYMSVNSELTDYNKIESLREAITSNPSTTWSRDLGGGFVCIREYEVVTFQPKPRIQILSYTYQLSRAVSEQTLSEIGKVLRMSVKPRTEMSWSRTEIGQHEAVFDADQLVFPLTVRCRQDGDTMMMMGLNGSKKVKDIFIDDKIPPSIRTQIPMVLDGSSHIIWIPGIRRSIHAPINHQTTSVLHLCFEDI